MTPGTGTRRRGAALPDGLASRIRADLLLADVLRALRWPEGEVAAVLGGRAEPVGCFYVRWRDPDEGHATVRKLEWDPGAAGSRRPPARAAPVGGGALRARPAVPATAKSALLGVTHGS